MAIKKNSPEETSASAAPRKKTFRSETEATATATSDARPQATPRKPDRSAIEKRAWEIWCREGCPEGKAAEHWLQAEKELSKS